MGDLRMVQPSRDQIVQRRDATLERPAPDAFELRCGGCHPTVRQVERRKTVFRGNLADSEDAVLAVRSQELADATD